MFIFKPPIQIEIYHLKPCFHCAVVFSRQVGERILFYNVRGYRPFAIANVGKLPAKEERLGWVSFNTRDLSCGCEAFLKEVL